MKGYHTASSGAKRYSYDTTLYHRQSPDRRSSDHAPMDLPLQFKQQLMNCLQEKENLKIAYEGEKASREFAEQQLEQSSRRLEDAHKQIDRLEAELLTVKDKYKRQKNKRMKEQPQPSSMDDAKELRERFDKEREVFLKEQQLLKEQIKKLQHQVQNRDTVREQEQRVWQKERQLQLKKLRSSEQRIMGDVRTVNSVKQALEKELQLAYAQIEDKSREVVLLESKFEQLQLDNIRTHQNIIAIEQEIERVRSENYRLKITIKKNEQAYQSSLAREAQEAHRRFSQLYEEVEELRAANRLRQNELRRVRFGQQPPAPAKPVHHLTEQNSFGEYDTKPKRQYGQIKVYKE